MTRDLEDLDLRKYETRFDRVLMNPPFERERDTNHVLHAYESLLQAGCLPPSSPKAHFRQEKNAKAFREFLRRRGATTSPLPADSFKNSGTRVSCRIVQVRKER